MEEKEERRCFLGVDWGSAKHWARLTDAAGRELGQKSFEHSGAGLAALADWALGSSGSAAAEVWVAIEVPHGPVVECLLERGLRVFSINPKQADRFRDRYSPAGAKDDARDSQVLSDALRTDPGAFRELGATSAQLVELREWSRMHESLQRDHARLVSELREQLWRYYPQVLKLAGDSLGLDWVCELLRLVPTPKAAKRLRTDTLARLFKNHGVRRVDAPGALAILREKPLQLAPGAVEAASAHVLLILPRLELMNRQLRLIERRQGELISSFEKEIEELGQPGEQRDVAVLRSSPGIGRTNLATLLAEAWEPLRRRDYHALRCLTGVAPVTRQSGKTRVVLRRYAANRRLANALHHWARVASQRDPATKAKYAALRARGCSHGRALRGLGDRLLGVACAMLRSQTDFDPNRATRTA